MAQSIFEFAFTIQNNEQLPFLAGQYLILKIGEQRRLFSISSSSDRCDQFELLVKLIPGGVASEYFKNIVVGETAQFQGPAGLFTFRKNDRNKIFMATGTGIAPILSILHSHLQEQTSQFILFWGLRTFDDVYYLEKLKELSSRYSNFQFFICLSGEENLDKIPEIDRKYFVLGRIIKGFEMHLKMFNVTCFMFNDFDFYFCGGRDAVESFRQYLSEKQIPKEQIYFEKY